MNISLGEGFFIAQFNSVVVLHALLPTQDFIIMTWNIQNVDICRESNADACKQNVIF